MDRLSALIACAALCACDDKTPPPESRVEAVKGAATHANPDDFCDVRFPDSAKAPKFALPALAGAPLPAGKGWRWVNIWATWCKPCVEEMARLQKWHDDLATTHPYALVEVAADDAGPDKPRFADPDALGSWATTVGLDATARIPIHVIVDPEDRVRCARVGPVHDTDLPAVEAMLPSTR